MVQTRRKTAAAVQDGGAVKENKAKPPAPQTPTKRAKRGRPPKIKTGERMTIRKIENSRGILADANTLNTPSTSSNLVDDKLLIESESQVN